MRISFPHMGNLGIALETVFGELGVQVVVPPPISEVTLRIGTGFAPEGCCLPFKVVVGSLAQALDSGADTIIMPGGDGPCRFGYYGHLAAAILRDRGHVFSTVILEGEDICRQVFALRREVGATRNGVLRALWLGWLKLKALDEAERFVHLVRPVEQVPGEASAVYRQVIEKIKAARNPGEIRRLTDSAGQWYFETKGLVRPEIRIGLVGDIYMLLEPYVNHGLEEMLENRGIVTHRSIYISDWVAQHLWPYINRQHIKELLALARPYLSSVVGGHGLDTVANTIRYARSGYDGVIQILPLTCTPEIVAQSILPKVAKDYNIPVLSLVLDEHASPAGVLSRIEAFADMLQSRRGRLDKKRPPS